MELYLCRCPPGHGDIYSSLLGSGMLDRLIKSGIKYLFVSNSDNLGATLDLDLLAYFASSKKAFVCEVAERTAADKKGGHLAKRKSDGRLVLRESAMCPDEDKGAFEDISKYSPCLCSQATIQHPLYPTIHDAAHAAHATKDYYGQGLLLWLADMAFCDFVTCIELWSL